MPRHRPHPHERRLRVAPLADLTSLANRLWVTEPATVEMLAKGLFAESGGGDTVWLPVRRLAVVVERTRPS